MDCVHLNAQVMDSFCLERGVFLDEPDLVALEYPNLHTLHCLLDPQVCVESPFEILLDPLPGQTLYRRGITLDDGSKDMVIELGRSIGNCDICSEDMRLERGFRVRVTATVTSIADGGASPTISVSEMTPIFYVTDSSTEVTFQVGDKVMVTGFIMDRFCIELGMLLDAPSIRTLEEPNLHSLHCLVDVISCAESPYEVLLDPAPGSNSDYTRGFVLDEEGKALVITKAREVGVCDTCDGTGTWEKGFRAEIHGTIEALGQDGEPPIISVQLAKPKRLNPGLLPPPPFTDSTTVAPTVVESDSSSPSVILDGKEFILTESEYEYTRFFDKRCQEEFDDVSMIAADWQEDISQLSEEQVDELLTGLGIIPTFDEMYYIVTYDGGQFLTVDGEKRTLFMEYHDGPPPSDWFVVSQYAGLTLGATTNFWGPILCARPVNNNR